VPLHVRDTGSGPAILLLHGSPSTTAYFAPLVARLGPRYRVLVPELPGYGASPPIAGEYLLPTVQGMIQDTHVTRGIREVAVLGFSMGAYRALTFALTRSACVSRAWPCSVLSQAWTRRSASGIGSWGARLTMGWISHPNGST
jgi:pimeloyl-ACP methyl ester carboxylesterase